MKLQRLSKTIDFRNVEELNLHLRTERDSRERFSIETDPRLCANGILAAFNNEVRNRGMETILDDDTKAHILEAARWLVNPIGKPGLLLCGLYGNGKTTLARAIQHFVQWVTEAELGYDGREQVYFHTSKQILRSFMEKYDEYEVLLKRRMLIIDDLGEEPKEVMKYGRIETPIIDLINERYEKRQFTIITTNLNTDEINAKYGKRIYDRFCEILDSIVFTNDSYRQRK